MMHTAPAPAPERLDPQPSAVAAEPFDDIGFVTSHRWWRLGWQPRPDGSDAFALIGTLNTVWRSSVAAVACRRPGTTDHGPCPCSLHEPEEATGKARAVSSVAVSGRVRVLASQVQPTLPAGTVLALVEGPLRVVIWCDGAQDGFTHERCDRTPRWVIPTRGTATALCRKHYRRLPRDLRNRRHSLGTFRREVARSLAEYGVDVILDAGTSPRTRPSSQRAVGHLDIRPQNVRDPAA